MNKVNIGNDLYLKGRIGWKGLSKSEYLKESDYRIINATSLEDKLINWDICGYISKDRYEESPEIQLKEKDILISKDGTLGKIGYVKNLSKQSTVASGVFVLRNTKTEFLDTDYLYHFLKSNYFKLFISRIKADGSTINHLYQRDLSQFTLELPPINTQKKIASILSSIDEKIELNNKIKVELENFANTFYDYWFVQFDFPDKNGKPYKSNGGKMVNNSEIKREIPEDWEIGELSDIANITMGQSPPGNSYNERGLGEVFYQGCTDFGDRSPIRRLFTTKPSRMAKKGDILLSVRAPVGTMNIANESCCIGRGLSALHSKNGIDSYLYGVMRYFQIIFDRQNGFGTTFGAITKNELFSLKVIKPNELLLTKFEKYLKPVYSKLNQMDEENRELKQLRNWLLPMLMNGQVKVVGN